MVKADLAENKNIGVVVIGRNEGERLLGCLRSLIGSVDAIIYVDSGSTDLSAEAASELGVDVLALDLNIPFTAARARNEGVSHLMKIAHGLKYVQFVDGDCEVISGWIDKATAFLDRNQQVAVVCGRRRERYPDRSIYNLMCDIEWDTPVGEAKSCGGDALMRVDAFQAVGGYRNQLIAGEEPELCVRLRGQGWKIWRLDEEMTLHDAAITRVGQWWSRCVRSGHAYAEGAHLHSTSPERHRVDESRRAFLWGLWIPVIAVGLTTWLGAWGLLVLLAYPVQIIRLALQGTRSVKVNWMRALFLVIGKFPELIGQLIFLYRRLVGRKQRLIEYK